MEKPSSILYREFSNNIANVINQSGLPAFVMVPVIQNVLHELDEISNRQYKADVEAYEKSLKEKTK